MKYDIKVSQDGNSSLLDWIKEQDGLVMIGVSADGDDVSIVIKGGNKPDITTRVKSVTQALGTSVLGSIEAQTEDLKLLAAMVRATESEDAKDVQAALDEFMRAAGEGPCDCPKCTARREALTKEVTEHTTIH